MTLKSGLVNQPSKTLDQSTTEEIYERYNTDIYRYAYRLLDDSELAEDCAADTFHRFLIAIRVGTEFENVRAYLYRIAHNWITDHYRRHPLSVLALEEETYSDPDGNPSHLVAQKMDRQRVRAAILRLPDEQRQVVEMRFMENWSHADVADALGKSVDATRALQYRAMETLRQILSEPVRLE